ncbi:hypothetical protein, partial [Halorubrum sp. F4]
DASISRRYLAVSRLTKDRWSDRVASGKEALVIGFYPDTVSLAGDSAGIAPHSFPEIPGNTSLPE